MPGKKLGIALRKEHKITHRTWSNNHKKKLLRLARPCIQISSRRKRKKNDFNWFNFNIIDDSTGKTRKAYFVIPLILILINSKPSIKNLRTKKLYRTINDRFLYLYIKKLIGEWPIPKNCARHNSKQIFLTLRNNSVKKRSSLWSNLLSIALKLKMIF